MVWEKPCSRIIDIVNCVMKMDVTCVFIVCFRSQYSVALCRTKLLPVTHVLVDTWMLTVKPVYKLLNVSDDLKWTTNTHMTPFILTLEA